MDPILWIKIKKTNFSLTLMELSIPSIFIILQQRASRIILIKKKKIKKKKYVVIIIMTKIRAIIGKMKNTGNFLKM